MSVQLPTGIAYNGGQCKWVDGYLIWQRMAGELPVIYRYTETDGSFTLLGSLPPGGATMMRFVMGYAWIVRGKNCTILKLEPGLPHMYATQIRRRDLATLSRDDSWVLINAVYTANRAERGADITNPEINAIMYRIGEGGMDMICVCVARAAELIAHDTHGVIYRTDFTETLHIWSPSRGVRSFNPCEMLPRSSDMTDVEMPAYVGCTRNGIITCIVVPGMHGIILANTFSGYIAPFSLQRPASERILIVGGDCSHVLLVDSKGRFIDAGDNMDITRLLTDAVIRQCGHSISSTDVIGSTGILNATCVHGHSWLMQIRAENVVR